MNGKLVQGWRGIAALACAAVMAGGAAPAPAQAGMGLGFGTGSLNGVYSAVGQGDGGLSAVVAIGSIVFDGQGALAGQLEQSEPTSSPACGERPVVQPTVIGSYFVEPNGTGGGTLTVTSTTAQVTTDFALVVTDSVGPAGNRTGRDVAIILEEPDPIAGGITRFSLTLRPSLESGGGLLVSGSFATTCIGLGGQVSEGGVGIIEFFGDGTTMETTTANMPGPTYTQRVLVEVQQTGTFSVDPATGIGTIVRNNAPNARFLVTRARIIGGVPTATELFVTARQVDPATGNLTVEVARRLN